MNARKLGFIHSVCVEIVNFECICCQHCFDGTIITEAEGQEGTTNEMNESKKESEQTNFCAMSTKHQYNVTLFERAIGIFVSAISM